jgi:O-antigen/teichoic acid export membrane protein
MFSQLLRHASNYTLGNGLLIAAGLVSFPILTRLLSVDEYGLMSLVATALSLLVGVGKLGMQHATLRFHSEIQAGKRSVGSQAFIATVVYGMGAIGLATTLGWALISQVVPAAWWNDPRVQPLMLLTAVLIFVRVMDSAFVNQLRAQERSGTLMIYSVVRRYVALALMLFVMFQVAGNVWGFYAATIAGEVLATAAMAVWLYRRAVPRPADFSSPLFRAMLAFGIPMIGYELSSIVLSMGDRYIIQSLLGAEPLGVYSAAYNMCDYIKSMLFGSLVAAAQPMYMRYWEQEGAGTTTEFLSRFLRLYVMAAMLVVGGLAAIGAELLGFLASAKYREGAEVIPYVVAAMALESVLVITGAGLYLQKRSKTIMLLVLLTAVMNLGLNYLLIPRLGILGAGASMLISYTCLMLAGATLGRRSLRLALPLGALFKFGGIAVAMYLLVTRIDLHSDLATMLARMAAGLLLYAGLTLALDRQAREGVQYLRSRWAR